MRSLAGFLVFCAFFTGLSASAEGVSLARRFGIGGFGGASIPVASATFKSSTNTGWAGGAFLDYFISDEVFLELAWDHLQFSPSLGNTQVDGFGGTLNWRISGANIFTPTLGAGAGYCVAGNSQSPLFNFSNAFVGLRGSLDYLASEKIILSAGAKYLWIFNSNSGTGDHSLDLNPVVPFAGITLLLGKPGAAAPAPAPAPAPEPSPSATPEPSPSPAPVAKTLNTLRCKDVPPGTKVNSLGCPVGQKVEIRLNVEFDFAKTTIRKSYFGDLKRIGKLLQDHPDLEISVQGHADDIGTEAENLKLSRDRAETIREYLIKNYSIDGARIEAVGFGERKPVASNKTKAGRQRNRRVIGVFSTTLKP